MDTLRTLPVPNLGALDTAEQELLSNRFDSVACEALQPLPHLHEDPVRRQIDNTVIKAMGFDPEWVATIRRELALEPSIVDA